MELAPVEAGFSPERLARITEHLTGRYIEPGRIAGCQTLVARHGHIAHFESLGSMDRERARPMTADTIFRIYSMTKPVTSVALMSLFEEGRFQLHDPVSRFLPEWRDQRVWVSGEGDAMVTKEPDRPMTMQHLLSHTGGLSYGVTRHPADRMYGLSVFRPRRDETLRSLADRLGRVPLRFEPGTRWMYSYSTDVCAALVEVISGKRFDEYLRETIFEPLAMHDTGFAVKPDDAHRLAANYEHSADKTLRLIDDPETSTFLRVPTFLSGSGGLTSTTADYLRFCEMLRRGGELDGARILGPRTIALMTRNHLPGNGDLTQMSKSSASETAPDGVGFGLGFAITLNSVAAGTLGQGDYYWGGAASTIFWVDPNEDLIVIFMTQLMPSGAYNTRGELKSLVYSAIVE